MSILAGQISYQILSSTPLADYYGDLNLPQIDATRVRRA